MKNLVKREGQRQNRTGKSNHTLGSEKNASSEHYRRKSHQQPGVNNSQPTAEQLFLAKTIQQKMLSPKGFRRRSWKLDRIMHSRHRNSSRNIRKYLHDGCEHLSDLGSIRIEPEKTKACRFEQTPELGGKSKSPACSHPRELVAQNALILLKRPEWSPGACRRVPNGSFGLNPRS